MKNVSLKIFAAFGRLPRNISSNFNAMLGLKARPLLAVLIKSVGAVCKVSLKNSRIAAIFLLTSRLAFLRKRMGLKGLTLYLKACFVLYQQSLGDYNISDSALISKARVSRNNRGIPRIIPRMLRNSIRLRYVPDMKLISSILNLYRDIKYPGVPKLGTITEAYKGTLSIYSELSLLTVPFIRLFCAGFEPRRYMDGGFGLFIIWKAAPGMLKDTLFGTANYSTHPSNIFKSLRAIWSKPNLRYALLRILTDLNQGVLLGLISILISYGLLEDKAPGALGKLHAKEEPAGKVRLFAMVDPISQWALYPLHKYIFKQLRGISQDGTFNQTAPLEALLARKPKELYSLDLTAATDRLPLWLQVLLLTTLVSVSFAWAWAELLTGRTYGFHQMGYSAYHGNYKYATGQPMGAYSSWAMLALTHHFLVQVSAWRANVVPIGIWFQDYAVLGDDLVIANKRVAEEYLKLLKELGMEVNLHKSILSATGRCLEFAKRTYYILPDGSWVDISPVPIKEMASAQSLLPALVQFGIKYQLTPPQLLQSFNFGWRNISQINKPLGKLSAQVRTILLGLALPKSADDLLNFFNMGAPRLAAYVADMVQVGIDFKLTTLVKMVPRVKVKLDKAIAFSDSKDSLIQSMVNTTLKRVASQALGVDLTELTLTPEQEAAYSWWLTSKVSLGAHVGLPIFFQYLWENLYGPACAAYLETARDVLFNVEAMAGKHRGNSMLVLPSFHSLESKVSYGFFQRYWDFLMTIEELATVSPSVLSFERPEGTEGISLSYSAVTPLHLRYYRLWSGIIQGSLPMLGVGLNILSPPAGSLPTEAKVELEDSDDEY